MNLAIDAGNSRIKLAGMKEGELQGYALFNDLHDFEEELNQWPTDQPVIFSNVGNWPLEEALNRFSDLTELTPELPLPIKMAYQTPQTLGNDRRALAVAAWHEFPETNVLVVDLGSCVTYDFIDQQGTYQGGGISPGLQMRLKSLHHFTANLPLVETNESEVPLVGNNTENSIRSGVINGFKAEVEQTIGWYYERFTSLSIVFTGGDAGRFVHFTKNGIFARPKFLLTGLHHILEYNVQKR